jgi:phosphotriesterase-related protein
MLSHDAVACMLGRQSKAMAQMIEKCPNWNYAHICKNILPALRKGGVAEATIRKLTVDNPREYFGG